MFNLIQINTFELILMITNSFVFFFIVIHLIIFLRTWKVRPKSYNLKMLYTLRVRTSLWVAVGFSTYLAVFSANASNPTAGTAPTSASKNLLVAPQKYIAPADNVLQDLKAGLRKLQRLCSVADVKRMPENTANAEASQKLQTQWALATITLTRVRQQTSEVFAGFERDSRMRTNQACQLAPSWLPGCGGYLEDQKLLEAASLAANRLFEEAAQRLEFYSKYAELESTGCTRKGFTQRLWQTEERYLWPLVTGAPAYFDKWLYGK